MWCAMWAQSLPSPRSEPEWGRVATAIESGEVRDELEPARVPDLVLVLVRPAPGPQREGCETKARLGGP